MKYDNTEQFIRDFRNYIEVHGITNAHIARQMDISPQQLQNIYKKKELTVSDVINMCNAIKYKCTVTIERM